jgi:carboxypeptidase C (cathepsin A)
VETLADSSNGVPVQNDTFQVGTFPTQYTNSSTNDTTNAGKALWHFVQAWFQEFPAYKPNNDAISIFRESYGGRYGPAFAAFFEEQNMCIVNGSINVTGDIFIVHLDTLGIVNGCVDLLTQELAYNNTYCIQVINQSLYQQVVDNFNRPDTDGGDLIINCRNVAAVGDLDATGNNDTVNQACIAASVHCFNEVESQYINTSGRNYHDIAVIDPDPFPPSYYIGFLAQHWVQAALDVLINYIQSINGVYNAFQSTGDYARTDIRSGRLTDLAYLLDNGVKVAFMYDDLDYVLGARKPPSQ